MKFYDQPQIQAFHLKGVLHIHPLDAHSVLQNRDAILFDLREAIEARDEVFPFELVQQHPVSTIEPKIKDFDKNQSYILACPGGVRSTQVAAFMMVKGFPHVFSMDGGIEGWKQSGLEMQLIQSSNLVRSNSKVLCNS